VVRTVHEAFERALSEPEPDNATAEAAWEECVLAAVRLGRKLAEFEDAWGGLDAAVEAYGLARGGTDL
jgi:hypothetical protein